MVGWRTATRGRAAWDCVNDMYEIAAFRRIMLEHFQFKYEYYMLSSSQVPKVMV